MGMAAEVGAASRGKLWGMGARNWACPICSSSVLAGGASEADQAIPRTTWGNKT